MVHEKNIQISFSISQFGSTWIWGEQTECGRKVLCGNIRTYKYISACTVPSEGHYSNWKAVFFASFSCMHNKSSTNLWLGSEMTLDFHYIYISLLYVSGLSTNMLCFNMRFIFPPKYQDIIY